MTKLTSYEFTPSDIHSFIMDYLRVALSLHNEPLDVRITLDGQKIDDISNFIAVVHTEITP